MAIHLNVSVSPELLAEELTRHLNGAGTDPFTADWIVTQTEGMNLWLRQRLALRQGIAANLRFCTPEEIVSGLAYWLETDMNDPLSKEMLRWVIYDILGTQDFRDAFPVIMAYYAENDVKRIALSEELADIFDQYQIYRVEKLKQWELDGLEEDEDFRFQCWLWRRVKTEYADQFSDRPRISDAILSKLSEADAKDRLGRRFRELHIFGVAIITPYYLRIFHALSSFMEVHLYLINPSPGIYWLDDRSQRQIARLMKKEIDISLVPMGNDLLLNWGSVIREAFLLLFRDDDMIDRYHVLESEMAEGQEGLLQKIQLDIRDNLPSSQRRSLQATDLNDGTITINGCFTPIREVEVLYNHLVSLVNDSVNGLSGRDILVLVSDIDLYAPLIRAVFGNAPYKIPFTIADETVTSENNMFSALQMLLELDEYKLMTEDVMELLESPYIRTRFRFSDTEAVREAVREAGIIFGLRGREEDETRFLSWEYGLKRMMNGICISGETAYDDGTDMCIPLDTAEGERCIDRIRLHHFMKVLTSFLQDRNKDRTIGEWADFLQAMLEEMVFDPAEKDDEDYPVFLKLMDEMRSVDDILKVKIGFDVFCHSFLDRLSKERRSRSFLGSGITFCTMVPMRSIPFPVVAMLGMDMGKFPRKSSPLSFSLFNERHIGDRNIRNNDKHLFLETILSAGRSLYISYIARSEFNGEKLPPSSLVDELIDHVARGLGLDTDRLRDDWVTIHPLHGFNSIYFKEGGLRNYLSENRYRTGIEVSENTERSVIPVTEVIELENLLRFLENPPKTYLTQRLNVYYHTDENRLPDHEIFGFDGLSKWIIQDELIFTEEEIGPFVRDRKLKGDMPLANMGPVLTEMQIEKTMALREAYKSACNGQEETNVAVNIAFSDGTRLEGSLTSLYGNRLVSLCHSNDVFKYLLKAYVRLLVLRGMNLEYDLYFVTGGKKGTTIIPGSSISKDDAKAKLEILTGHYKKGIMGYFPFLPSLARKNFNFFDGDHQAFLRKMETAMASEYDSSLNCPYLIKAVEHGFLDSKLYDDLKLNVREIMGPVQELFPEYFQ
jgi:exodeoxyribonuclease V gamma subunit